MSWLMSDRSSSGPIFCRFITVATIKLPENSSGRYQPMVLASGLIAMRTGYFITSCHSDSPRAVRMATGDEIPCAHGYQPAGKHHRLVPARAVFRQLDRCHGDEPAKYWPTAAAVAH